ncbi:26S proteasome regulatory subunit N3 [Capronia coronata CBS 617.96]|uniref:26S proteasome regulatory subunit N3 n=1 Tax=Capronia coronata CBS 617.96 TaxID=1182541 RepID=W9YNW3_9EURO|nr:26S proteasome regulatory subunit N3 [Capronia coronata CBS 617.96]EXJ94632.1 26S proteasome regulatory subunit N3 [Capronia coronata CBS 617.96]
MSGDKPHLNGSDPAEKGIDGSEDVEMKEGSQNPKKALKLNKDKDGDDEMTVVVPPAKGSNSPSAPEKPTEADLKNGAVNGDAANESEAQVDPQEKVILEIKANLPLLERGVIQFDPRFSLRVLRSIPSTRKQLSAYVVATVVTDTYPIPTATAISLLTAVKDDPSFPTQKVEDWHSKKDTSLQKNSQKEILPEIDIYLSILVQVYLYDKKSIDAGAQFSSALVDHLRTLNRRTLDPLSARVYFYYALFFEELAPLPPSPAAAVISIRKNLLDALRTATLRKDQDIQAAVTTLLLRNYLSTSHITQADLLISRTKFPAAAANNQFARYLYYLGRIRAIQLSYTEAHEHLTGATRKSPTAYKASGFYQASTKLLVVVELLLGDIPDRAIFRQPSLEQALRPYLQLVEAVSSGDIIAFQNLVQRYNSTFRKDDTYTLILRLRQNVIRMGIRMMSLSYARISLRDMCLRLGLDSEESAEYMVAKAIRDGVIEASLDHERGFMKSKEVGDIYATREPGDVFHERIQACLALHDESVKAMRFPMNQHRLELKNAQEARDRERELAKEIVDGDMDDDDAPGGDFEGL